MMTPKLPRFLPLLHTLVLATTLLLAIAPSRAHARHTSGTSCVRGERDVLSETPAAVLVTDASHRARARV